MRYAIVLCVEELYPIIKDHIDTTQSHEHSHASVHVLVLPNPISSGLYFMTTK